MAKHFEELECWRLADKLRSETCAVCDTSPARADLNFCSSMRETAGSVCRNLSEGFARGESCEIVQFFRYALASLAELQDHLHEARTRHFIDGRLFDRLWDLSQHTKATSLNFMKPHKERCERQRKRKPAK